MLEYEGLTVDLDEHVVERDGRRLDLSPLEYDLLVTLLRRPRRVFTREELLDEVWGDADVGTGAVERYISYLRGKVDDGLRSSADSNRSRRGLHACVPESFAPFAARLTRGYVLLAVALIVLVVATTSVLAFLLYVGTLNDALGTYAQRATRARGGVRARRRSLTAYAPKLASEIGGARVARLGLRRRTSPARRERRRGAIATGRFTRAAAAFLGLHPAVVSVPGGTIVVAPDFAGFARLLERYLAFVLPIGALAVLAAWLIGRAFTRRAIAPLQDVSAALRRIAGRRLRSGAAPSRDGDLRELTAAYNDVAHRLTTATAERDRNEAQMRQFIADAGHELRTPLTIVMGYLEVLEQGVVRDADGIAHVYETMLAESRRMRASIDKLILLARLERPAPPRTGAHRRGRDCATRRRRARTARGSGRIALHVADVSVQVDADESELYEAIKNVLENAVRYAPDSRDHDRRRLATARA